MVRVGRGSMVLSSSVYFIFLVAVFLLYWPLSRFRAAGLAVVLFANYFFYAKWNLFYLALIPAASTADYFIALALHRARLPMLRRALVAASLAVNLGLLAAFKYMPLFLLTWAGIASRTAPAWDWVFPLGISFYAFQSLSYTLDVYRRDARPVSS
ncbi:MAG: MBOAT family O-acyltransferase, partial [Bryobacteraceae bacterium]